MILREKLATLIESIRQTIATKCFSFRRWRHFHRCFGWTGGLFPAEMIRLVGAEMKNCIAFVDLVCKDKFETPFFLY